MNKEERLWEEAEVRIPIRLRELKAMREVERGKQSVLVETCLQEILRKRIERGDKIVDGMVVKNGTI